MATIDDGGGSGNKAGVNASKQLLVTDSSRTRTGVYAATSGLITPSTAALAANVGHMYLHNPTGSGRRLAVRRVEIHSMGVAAAAVITRFTIGRVTSTGGFTGVEITPAKIDTTVPNNIGKWSAVTTGLTLSSPTPMFSLFLMSVITAAGAPVPVLLEYEPKEEGMLVLNAGESMLITQPDVGVATDPRRVSINVAWEEFI